MLRSARLLIVLLPLVALLASGSALARASNGPHHCEGMVAGMTMDDCLHGDANGGGEPQGCPPAVCVAAALFVVPQSSNFFLVTTSIVSSLPPRDDADLGGLSGPPELRPPIA